MAVFTCKTSDSQAEMFNSGITPVHHTVTIPTTALDSNDEQVLLYLFPTPVDSGEVLLTRCLFNIDDLDGATSLTYDVGLADSDGVLDTTIVSGATTGQSAGVLAVVDPSSDFPVTATGKYLTVDVTAASGTPASGDIEVYLEFTAGTLPRNSTAA